MCGAPMITYEVTASGLKGFQVKVIIPGHEDTVIGDFWTLLVAEAFAATMRSLDSGVTSKISPASC